MKQIKAILFEATCVCMGSCPCEVRETTHNVHYEEHNGEGGKLYVFDDDVYFEDLDSAVEWLETTDDGQYWLREKLIVQGRMEA